jgi:hypothetical protein
MRSAAVGIPAWVHALEHLAGVDDGKDVNVAVAFTGAFEDAAIPATLDEFVAEWRSQKRKSKIYPLATVANTVFPQTLYRGEPGEEARDRLDRLNERAMRVQWRLREKETYFNRFVNRPGRENINQLELVIERLNGAAGRCRPESRRRGRSSARASGGGRRRPLRRKASDRS